MGKVGFQSDQFPAASWSGSICPPSNQLIITLIRLLLAYKQQLLLQSRLSCKYYYHNLTLPKLASRSIVQRWHKFSFHISFLNQFRVISMIFFQFRIFTMANKDKCFHHKKMHVSFRTFTSISYSSTVNSLSN